MRKKNIVKYSRDFDSIIKNEIFIKNKNFIIYYKHNDLSYYRFGISVGKKIGNAVVRNYYKRVIRKIIDNNLELCLVNVDYIVIMRKNAINLNYNDLENSMKELLIKVEKEK